MPVLQFIFMQQNYVVQKIAPNQVRKQKDGNQNMLITEHFRTLNHDR